TLACPVPHVSVSLGGNRAARCGFFAPKRTAARACFSGPARTVSRGDERAATEEASLRYPRTGRFPGGGTPRGRLHSYRLRPSLLADSRRGAPASGSRRQRSGLTSRRDTEGGDPRRQIRRARSAVCRAAVRGFREAARPVLRLARPEEDS